MTYSDYVAPPCPCCPNDPRSICLSKMVNITLHRYKYADEVSQVKDKHVIKYKESLVHKAFLVMVLAFVVVVCSIHSMQGHLDKLLSSNSTNLFGE